MKTLKHVTFPTSAACPSASALSPALAFVFTLALGLSPHTQAQSSSPDWNRAKIEVPRISFDRLPTKAKPHVIAIIDTGLDLKNPLFRDRLWQNPGETGLDSKGRDKSQNGVDDDGNGYIDDVHGWNFVGHNSQIQDRHGHGTHVTGLILQAQDSLPSEHQSKLMVIKYFEESSSPQKNLAATLEGLRYALDHGADLINYSGGGPDPHPVERQLLSRAAATGVLVVAAAGNDRRNTDLQGFYPASYGLSNVLSVAATGPQDELVRSSNFGLKTVMIAAPGFEILSWLPGGKKGRMTGTSQATAIVSGVASLVQIQSATQRQPELVIQKIRAGRVTSELLQGRVQGAGRINAKRSLYMQDRGTDAFGQRFEETYF